MTHGNVYGRFPAVCVDVVHSRQNTGFGLKDYVTLVYAVYAPGKDPVIATRKLPMTVHPGSALRLLLEAWRGVPFTDEQLDAFDIDNCVGVGAMARVNTHKSNGNRFYTHVQELSPLGKAETPRIPKDYIRQHHRQSVA